MSVCLSLYTDLPLMCFSAHDDLKMLIFVATDSFCAEIYLVIPGSEFSLFFKMFSAKDSDVGNRQNLL